MTPSPLETGSNYSKQYSLKDLNSITALQNFPKNYTKTSITVKQNQVFGFLLKKESTRSFELGLASNHTDYFGVLTRETKTERSMASLRKSISIYIGFFTIFMGQESFNSFSHRKALSTNCHIRCIIYEPSDTLV
jgi:hypothetical protein